MSEQIDRVKRLIDTLTLTEKEEVLEYIIKEKDFSIILEGRYSGPVPTGSITRCPKCGTTF